MSSSFRIVSFERAVIALLIFVFMIQHHFYRKCFQSKPIDTQVRIQKTTDLAMISMSTSETSYDYYAISNKDMYARKHGYDMIWDFKQSQYPKVWEKLNLIRDAVQASLSSEKSYKWIWMLDYDTLITNPQVKLEEIIERSLSLAESRGQSRDSIDIILAKDCEPINAGVMFFRVSPYTLSFIDQWSKGYNTFSEGDGRRLNEQEILWKMLANDELQMKKHSIITPQTWFDAYPKELDKCRDQNDSASWTPGMFLIHFAGANWFLGKEHNDAVGYLMRSYWNLFDHEKNEVFQA